MPINILMPALSPTMTEGNLARWLKQEGDAVSSGEPIVEIETDKATMEVEAADEGVLGRIVVPQGTEGVAVNAVIGVLLAEGEDSGALDRAAEAAGSSNGSGASTAAVDSAAVPPIPLSASAPAESCDAGPTIHQTVREALRDAIAEEMRRDEAVFLMGEEVAEYQGAYKISQGLLEEFGARRVIDTPITEHGFTGLAVGAAFAGLKPVVEFMTFNFAMQAMDQLVNSAAKSHYMSGGQMTAPIVFRGPNGAAARVAAQHSQCFASWYAHIPGLKVVAPYDAADAKGLLKSAIRDPNPVVFLENEILYGQSFDVPRGEEVLVRIGRARIARPGADVTIAAFSIAVGHALEAAAALAGEGIDAEVVDLRTLRPLDTATLVNSVRKTNRLVSVEEGWPVAGIGSELAAVMMEQAFDWLDAPVARVCAADVPLPYAANLERLALPQPDDIVRAAKDVLYRR